MPEAAATEDAVGIPEVAPQREDGKLLTEGVYGRMRHPRYAGAVLGLIAYALFVNYLALYLLVPLLSAGVYVISVLEERELRDRFGKAYVEYARSVPRFIPRVGGRCA